jgi:hypothetical protein
VDRSLSSEHTGSGGVNLRELPCNSKDTTHFDRMRYPRVLFWYFLDDTIVVGKPVTAIRTEEIPKIHTVIDPNDAEDCFHLLRCQPIEIHCFRLVLCPNLWSL